MFIKELKESCTAGDMAVNVVLVVALVLCAAFGPAGGLYLTLGIYPVVLGLGFLGALIVREDSKRRKP